MIFTIYSLSTYDCTISGDEISVSGPFTFSGSTIYCGSASMQLGQITGSGMFMDLGQCSIASGTYNITFRSQYKCYNVTQSKLNNYGKYVQFNNMILTTMDGQLPGVFYDQQLCNAITQTTCNDVDSQYVQYKNSYSSFNQETKNQWKYISQKDNQIISDQFYDQSCGSDKYGQIVPTQIGNVTFYEVQCVSSCNYNWYEYKSKYLFCTQQDSCQDAFNDDNDSLSYIDTTNNECVEKCSSLAWSKQYWFYYDGFQRACTETTNCSFVRNKNGTSMKYYNEHNDDQCVDKCPYFWYNRNGEELRCTEYNNCSGAQYLLYEFYEYLNAWSGECVEQCLYRQFLYDNQTTACTQYDTCYNETTSDGESVKYYTPDDNQCVWLCLPYVYEYKPNDLWCTASCNNIKAQNGTKLEYLNSTTSYCQDSCPFVYGAYLNYNYYVCSPRLDCNFFINGDTNQSYQYMKVDTKECFQICNNRIFPYIKDNSTNKTTYGCLLTNETCETQYSYDSDGKSYYFYDQDKQQCIQNCTYNWYVYTTFTNGTNDYWCTQNDTCINIQAKNATLNYLIASEKQCVAKCQYKQFNYSTTQIGCTEDDSCDLAVNDRNQKLQYYDQSKNTCVQSCQFYWFNIDNSGKNNYYCTQNLSCNFTQNGKKYQFLNNTKQCVIKCQYMYYVYNDSISYCTQQQTCNNIRNEQLQLLQYNNTQTGECVESCQYYWFQNTQTKACTSFQSCTNVALSNGNKVEYLNESNNQCISQCPNIWYTNEQKVKTCSNEQTCEGITVNGTLQKYFHILYKECTTRICTYYQFQYTENIIGCTTEYSCENAKDFYNNSNQYLNYKQRQCIEKCSYYWYYYLQQQKRCTEESICNVSDSQRNYLKYIQNDQCVHDCTYYWYVDQENINICTEHNYCNEQNSLGVELKFIYNEQCVESCETYKYQDGQKNYCTNNQSCSGVKINDQDYSSFNYDTKYCIRESECKNKLYIIFNSSQDSYCIAFSNSNDCSDLPSQYNSYKYISYQVDNQCVQDCQTNQVFYPINSQYKCSTNCQQLALNLSSQICQNETCEQYYHTKLDLYNSSCQIVSQYTQSCNQFQQYNLTKDCTAQFLDSNQCTACDQPEYELQFNNGIKYCQQQSSNSTAMYIGIGVGIAVVVVIVIIVICCCISNKKNKPQRLQERKIQMAEVNYQQPHFSNESVYNVYSGQRM